MSSNRIQGHLASASEWLTLIHGWVEKNQLDQVAIASAILKCSEDLRQLVASIPTDLQLQDAQVSGGTNAVIGLVRRWREEVTRRG